MSRDDLPTNPRPGRPSEAALDELFESQESTSAPRREVSDPWVLRSAVAAFALSAVVYTGFHVIDLAPPYPFVLALCVSAVLLRRAVRLTAEPDRQRTAEIIKSPRQGLRRSEAGDWLGDDDGMLDAVHRWDRRLDWGAASAERFALTVSGPLGELVDERLRQRHGITRQSDPARARELLGEEAWQLVHGAVDRVTTPHQISAVLDRLESL